MKGDLEPTMEQPSMAILEEWLDDADCDDGWNVRTLATDGCEVRPYSKCEHGHVCWLLYMGWT
jgi:hypothetical protein